MGWQHHVVGVFARKRTAKKRWQHEEKGLSRNTEAARWVKLGSNWVCYQNNDPQQSCMKIAFLKLEWPGRSPDLNPIEFL